MRPLEIAGVALCLPGVAISCLNFYLSFLRYPLLRCLGKAPADIPWVSGIPLCGSLLLWIGAAFFAGKPVVLGTVLAISLLDTGGLHWFAAMMLCQSLFRGNQDSPGNRI
jgi:hypothetical protein